MLFTKIFYLYIFLILIILFFGSQMTAYKSPEPKFQVIKKDGNIEIREYPPLLVAETQVEGERYAAINAGFKILADYIFGNNSNVEKIAMSAPVIQQGTKIPMTAPVIQQKNGNTWDIRFVMPAEFTLKTLPKPNNKNITLLQTPVKKYIIIRFSGSNTQENLNYHQELLTEYILKHQLKQIGLPLYAFYNPPWILPLLRRNEIMIEIN